MLFSMETSLFSYFSRFFFKMILLFPIVTTLRVYHGMLIYYTAFDRCNIKINCLFGVKRSMTSHEVLSNNNTYLEWGILNVLGCRGGFNPFPSILIRNNLEIVTL
jgi:hypothetical protein